MSILRVSSVASLFGVSEFGNPRNLLAGIGVSSAEHRLSYLEGVHPTEFRSHRDAHVPFLAARRYANSYVRPGTAAEIDQEPEAHQRRVERRLDFSADRSRNRSPRQ